MSIDTYRSVQPSEAVALTIREHMEQAIDVYSAQHPAIDLILHGKKSILNGDRAKGPWQEFPIITGGPGRAKRIDTGSELFGGTRRKIFDTAQVEPTRIVYSWDITQKELDRAATNAGQMEQLLEAYMDTAMEDILQSLAKQFYTGCFNYAGANGGYEGIPHLNGDVTTEVTLGWETGACIWAAPASQTTEFHDVPRQGASGGVADWYNQFAYISSFSDNGERLIRDMIAKTRQKNTGKGSWFMLSDPASFNIFEAHLQDKQRYTGGIRGGEKGADRVSGLYVANGVPWIPDYDFDDNQQQIETDEDGVQSENGTAVFTTYPGQGLAYLINQEAFRGFTVKRKNPDGKYNKYGWVVPDPQRVPRQEVWEYSMGFDGGAMITQLKSMGCVAGMRN